MESQLFHKQNQHQLELCSKAFNEILQKMPIKAREKTNLQIPSVKSSNAVNKAITIKSQFKSFTDQFKQDVSKMLQMRSIWMRFDKLLLTIPGFDLQDTEVSEVRDAFNKALISQINKDLTEGFS